MSTLRERIAEYLGNPWPFDTTANALLREAAEALRNAEDDTQQAIDNGSEAVAEWQKAHEESQAENARLTSEVARLSKEGALQRAINRAAEFLPDGVIINVSVECGAGWISVYTEEDGREREIESNDRTLAQQVEDEITEAIDDAKP